MKQLVPFLLLTLLFTACGNRVVLTNLTVEMQDGSQPLATAEPRFSWQYESDAKDVVQTEYRIIVATTEEKAKYGVGDLWDSKYVKSDEMLYIPYQGVQLKSRDIAYWKVESKVRYGKGHEKKVTSEVKRFEISLLNNDDWQAHWIGKTFDDDVLKGHTRIAARYLRKEFELKDNIESARLYICGLGVYSAYINGKEVAPDELLKPTLSDYTKHVYFNTYDVTEMTVNGENAIGVTLEGGRFTTIRYDSATMEWCGINHAAHYGLPQLLLQLEVTYQDGGKETIVSDEGWKITNRGPIRKSNEFDGETYDARMELGDWTKAGYDDQDWLPVVVDFDKENMDFGYETNPKHKVLRDPSCTACMNPHWKDLVAEDVYINLTPQPNPNIKVQEKLKPVAVFKKDNAWILDMGQNMVGSYEFRISNFKLKSGDTVTFRFAETLKSDSSLYTDNLRSAECTDRYIYGSSDNRTSGKTSYPKVPKTEILWRPMFTYHGFRYVEIAGLPSEPIVEDFTGLVFYDEMPVSGNFECSNEVMNAVYHNAYWGIRGNYRSMPTDCPQRDERMGWTGDRTTGCYGESYIFNNHRLYAKWHQDLADCQWENGSLSDVAPAYWRNYTDNMTWPGAFITVADMLYCRFGNIKPIKDHYDKMKLWMWHMKTCYEKDGVIVRDTYGDWCVPPESPEMIHTKDTNRMTWPAMLSTPFYCHLAGKMERFATLLGHNDDAEYYRNEINTTTEAFNRKYLNRETGGYSHNSVTSNLLPLAFGMVPKEMEQKVLGNIIDKAEREFDGHVSTGVVGIQQLMRTLTEFGRADLALRLATNETYPSWGYMVKNGATTIWELWNGDTGDPAMNSGNHVMLLGDLIIWEYEYLGGIRPLSPGYKKIELKPYPIDGLDYVKCTYNSVSGKIVSNWQRKGDIYEWDIEIPANTTAEVWLPTPDGYAAKKVIGSGKYHLTSSGWKR